MKPKKWYFWGVSQDIFFMHRAYTGDRSCDIEKHKCHLVSYQFDHFKRGSICLIHLGVWLGIEYCKNIFEMGIIPVKAVFFNKSNT